MQAQHYYEFTFDAVKISQMGLIIMCISVMLLLKKNFSKNRYGFLFALLLLLAVFNSYLLKFTSLKVPNFYMLFVLLAGPTLFFHMKEYQMVGSTSKKSYLKHSYLGIGLMVVNFFDISDRIKFLLTLIAIIHFGYYLILSVNVLSAKRMVVTNNSNLDISLLKNRWRNDFYLLTAIFFVYVTVIIESFFVQIKMHYRFTFIVMLISVIVLFIWLIFLRLRYAYQFYKNNANQKKEKYKNSILDREESKEISIRIEKLMKDKKPYLDSEINLNTIASQLKIHPKTLSQVINENFMTNFFDYINSLRIQDAKKMLLDPFYKEFKIYEIMYEVGFNSRSSFNTAFNKHTGMSASAFREKYS